MILAERSVAPFRLRRGTSPLIVSMPHAGTFVPHSVGRRFGDVAALRADTDWHMPRLYNFLESMGATVVVATHSRYVVDVNRPPGGENLYPGRDTPRLCPVDTFDSRPLYRDGVEPSVDEIGAFHANTATAAVEFVLPTLTSIVGGYDYQHRDNGVTMGRINVSLVQSF